MNSKIIVALDGMAWVDAIAIATQLQGRVWGCKVNDLLYDPDYNPMALLAVGNLMLDPKLYDIPATIKNTVARITAKVVDAAKHGAGRQILLTTHASAGLMAMQGAVEAAGADVTIVAITALTSFTDDELLRIYHAERHDLVRRLALLARRAGVRGIVCATDDLKVVDDLPFLKVVPGIRLPGDDAHDQVHIGVGQGANLVVVGRPITRSADRLAAVERLNDYLATSK